MSMTGIVNSRNMRLTALAYDMVMAGLAMYAALSFALPHLINVSAAMTAIPPFLTTATVVTSRSSSDVYFRPAANGAAISPRCACAAHSNG